MESKKLSRIIVGFTALILLIGLPLYAFKVYSKLDYTDFRVYYAAARRAKFLNYQQIYNLQDGASPFRYAPPLIAFFRPFAELNPVQAQCTWYGLQVLWFGIGFYWIYRTLQISLRRRSLRSPRSTAPSVVVTCLGVLFIFRFFLDTLTIGQVSSLMFLGFSFGLYAWVTRRAFWTSLALLVPTFFKIGPGFLLGLFASSRNPLRKKAALTTGLVTSGFLLIPWVWTQSWETTKTLWMNWLFIVSQDSTYYDASHYGSQSINSFLLRGVRSGWFTFETAHQLHLISACLLCGGIALFWSTRRARSFLGRGLFFSLGLFAPVLVMPETFKYSLTPLAIPFVLLWISEPRKIWLKWAKPMCLGFAILTLSLAGKDVIGDEFFFWNQIHSLPLFASVGLFLLTLALAWEESFPSPMMTQLLASFRASHHPLPLWKTLPDADAPLRLSVLIPIELGSKTYSNAQGILRQLESWREGLVQTSVESSFEILIILWGSRLSPEHPVARHLLELEQSIASSQCAHPSLRILWNHEAGGPTAALRNGFLESRGRHLIFSHIEQTIDPQFLQEWLNAVLEQLSQGVDLVRGNRRLPESRFKIPVRFLSLVYGRHQLGLLLNSILRLFLPSSARQHRGMNRIEDTLSPMLGISRGLAIQAFATQSSCHSLFYLELSLVCKASGYLEIDLPVSLQINLEKSWVRVFLEGLQLVRELPKILLQSRAGTYSPIPRLASVTADDWGLSPGVNQGILHLAQQGIIRRISVMANTRYIEDGLHELLAIPGIEVGLHFNLTYGKPLQNNPPLHSELLTAAGELIPSPARFLARWMNPWSRSRADHIRFAQAEFESQLKRLRDLAIPVDYLDGHHHIHLVPGLLKAMSGIMIQNRIKKVRLPYDPQLWKTPQAPLLLLSLWAQPVFKAFNLKALPCLYPSSALFYNHPKLRGILRSQLIRKPDTEIIVHPAAVNDLQDLEFLDSYQDGRVIEFQSLQMLLCSRAPLLLKKEPSLD